MKPNHQRWDALFAVLLTFSAIPAQAQDRRAVNFEQVVAAATDHPLVAAARARARAAHGSRRTAGAFPNPVGAYQIENAAFPGQRASDGLVREDARTLTLPIEPLYQRGARVRQADEDIRAAEAATQATERSVLLDAARAFFRAALAQINLEGATANQAGLDGLVTYNQKRVTEGVTAEGELLRVKLERDRASAQAAAARAEVARANASLGAYLGDVQVNSIDVGSLLAFLGVPLPPLAELVSYARQCRPELVAARARSASKLAAASVERALTLRQIGATIGQKRAGPTSSMIAGLSIALPLFDRNRGEVARAEAEHQASAQELVWAEKSVMAEVKGAREATELLSGEVNRLGPTFLARADEINRITLVAYEDGAASLLEVLDAARTLNGSRLEYYQTLFSARQSHLELVVAAGIDPLASPPGVRPSASCSNPTPALLK